MPHPPPPPATPRPGALRRFGPPAALLLAAAVAGLLPVRSVDFFWHLAAGRWMLEQGRLPRLDPFRFTSEAVPWVDHEWGFQLLLGLGERLGGLELLVLGRAALLTAVAGLLLAGLRRQGAGGPAAVLVALVALLGLRGRLLLRPELATLSAFALLLLLLGELRRRGGWQPAAGILLLTAAWTNLHPGVLAAPPLVAAYLLGAWLEGRRERHGDLADPARAEASSAPTPEGDAADGGRTPRAEASSAAGPGTPVRIGLWQVAALPALAAGAILLNPWGFEVFLVPLRIARALEGLPATNPDWAPLWRQPPLFLAAALAGLALLLLRTRRRGPGLDLGLALVVLALLALTLTAARHQGMLWIAGALLAGSALASGRGPGSAEQARPLRPPPDRSGDPAPAPAAGPRTPAEQARPLRPPPSRSRVPGPGLAAGLCLAAAAWCLVPAGIPLASSHPAGLGVAPGRFPEGAVEALQGWEPVGCLYNSAVFGGYLLYRLYPPRQVFYDTRNEVDPALLRAVARARGSSPAWEELLARYAIDAALVRYEERPRPVITPASEPGAEPVVEAHTASAFLFPPERFALVFWDDVSMLFVARSPEREERLAREEYRYVQPEDWRHLLRRAAADPGLRRGVAGELERKLRQDPASRRAAGLRRLLEAGQAPEAP